MLARLESCLERKESDRKQTSGTPSESSELPVFGESGTELTFAKKTSVTKFCAKSTLKSARKKVISKVSTPPRYGKNAKLKTLLRSPSPSASKVLRYSKRRKCSLTTGKKAAKKRKRTKMRKEKTAIFESNSSNTDSKASVHEEEERNAKSDTFRKSCDKNPVTPFSPKINQTVASNDQSSDESDESINQQVRKSCDEPIILTQDLVEGHCDDIM